MTHHKYGETSAGPHKQGSAALPGAAPASRSVAPSAPSPAMDRSEPGERSAGLRSSQPGAGGRDGSTPRDPHASACPPDHPLAVLLADADADAQTRPALRALWTCLADLPASRQPPRRTVDALAAELADARRAGAAPTLAAVVAAVAHACEQAAPRSIAGARRLAAESLMLDADATADRLAVDALAALALPALDLPLLAAGGAR